jgi:hypothetical protein
MSIYTKVSGAWKEVIEFYTKHSNSWRTVIEGYVKKDGNWVQFWPSGEFYSYSIVSNRFLVVILLEIMVLLVVLLLV